MAHGAFNPYGSFMVTRVVNGTGTGQWVIKIPLNYTGNTIMKGTSFSGKSTITGYSTISALIDTGSTWASLGSQLWSDLGAELWLTVH